MLPEVLQPHDRFIDWLETRVVESTPAKSVVQQPDAPPLGNHVGVRHASAIYAAAYEASRALVRAALGERADSAPVALIGTSIAYTRVGMGPLTFVAEPEGDGWDTVADGAGELTVSVTGTDQNGKTVASMTARWSVSA
jgi:acyl-coenzyme A thioesterase PaaI-like protein